MPFGTISFPLPLTLYPILLWSLYLFDHIHSILYNWHIFFSLFVKYLCFHLTIILNNPLWSIFFSNTLYYAISWFLIALYPQKAHPFFFFTLPFTFIFYLFLLSTSLTLIPLPFSTSPSPTPSFFLPHHYTQMSLFS